MPSKADVARALRAARDLMNGNGRHWMKGDAKFTVTEQHIAIRDNESKYSSHNRWLSPKAQVGDTVFCTWGGLAEVCKDDKLLQVEAMEALVKIIEPHYGLANYNYVMEEELDNYEAEVEYDRQSFLLMYPTFDDYWNAQLDYREEMLGEVIASWNDADARMWEDVKTSLTAAAAAKAKSKS